MSIHHDLTKLVLIYIIIGASDFHPLRIWGLSCNIYSFYPHVPNFSHWFLSLVAININEYVWDLVKVHWEFRIYCVYFLSFFKWEWFCFLYILWFDHFLVFKLTLRYCDKYVFVFKLFQVEINYFIKVYPERKLFLTRFFKHICTLKL